MGFGVPNTTFQCSKLCWVTRHFTALKFCVWHAKTHGVQYLIKQYHLEFDSKLVYGTCAIGRIPCAFVAYINMLEKPYYPGVSHNKQSRYHNVLYFTYWPVLGTYNSWNMINFTNIIRSKEDFDEIHMLMVSVIITHHL